MLDTVILHIGATKTGTSAIQSGLVLNREALLEKGVHYPAAKKEQEALEGLVTSGNAQVFDKLYDTFVRGRFDRAELDAYLDEIVAETRAPVVLFSAERISGYSVDFANILAEALKARFKTVRVIFYVRHIVDHAMSQYGEMVKRRGMRGEFALYARRYRAKFDLHARSAVEAYGRKSVEVALYDDIADRIFKGFIERLGLDPSGLAQPGRVNRSLSATENDLIREINALDVRSSLVAKIVAEYSASGPMRGDKMTVPQAAVDVITANAQAMIDYINSEFALPNPLKVKSDKVIVAETAPREADSDLLRTMLLSAVRAAEKNLEIVIARESGRADQREARLEKKRSRLAARRKSGRRKDAEASGAAVGPDARAAEREARKARRAAGTPGPGKRAKAKAQGAARGKGAAKAKGGAKDGAAD